MRMIAVLTGLVLCLSLSPDVSGADCPSEIVSLKGEPKIMKNGSDEWVSCAVRMALDHGDRVRTAAGESVNIMYFSSRMNIVSISEKSDVVIAKGAPCAIELVNGEAMALIKQMPKGSTFEVKTPVGISGARGTGWGSSTNGEQATFSSYEDSIYVKGVDRSGNAIAGELVVEQGFRATVYMFEKPKRLEKLSGADMDKWNSWKESISSEGPPPGAGSECGGPADDREKLDMLSEDENSIESLESKKQDIQETRDISNITEGSGEGAPAERRQQHGYITR